MRLWSHCSQQTAWRAAEHRLSLFTYSILAHNRSLCHHCIWEQLARNISIYQQQQAVALFLSDVFMFCCPPPSYSRGTEALPQSPARLSVLKQGGRERGSDPALCCQMLQFENPAEQRQQSASKPDIHLPPRLQPPPHTLIPTLHRFIDR